MLGRGVHRVEHKEIHSMLDVGIASDHQPKLRRFKSHTDNCSAKRSKHPIGLPSTAVDWEAETRLLKFNMPRMWS